MGKVKEIKTAPIEPSKPSGISLPMNGSSDDWMDDDVGLTMDDEDEEEVKAEEPIKAEEVKPEKEPVKVEELKKPSGISLPMTEASDDWMDDDVGLTMDDEDDDDVKVEEPVKVEEVKAEEEPVKVEETKKTVGISLPMTEASDD